MYRYLVRRKKLILMCFIAISYYMHSVFEDYAKYAISTKTNVRQMKQNYFPLLEHLKTLHAPELTKCNVTNTTVHYRTESMKQVYTSSILVPNWQTRKQDNKTRHLSAILRVRIYKNDKAKWSVAELKQWIHYQFWAGTEHIYICNHFRNKSEMISDMLLEYTKRGLITLMPWNTDTFSRAKLAKYLNPVQMNQLGCYEHVLKKYGHQSKWMYVFDMDEYPYSSLDHCEGFFARYLERVENKNGADGATVYIDNFLLKGKGDLRRDIMIDRINRITPQRANSLVKPVFRADSITEVVMHGVRLKKGKQVSSNPKEIKMLHYWGSRTQNWGPDNKNTLETTVVFNAVRDTLAVAVRHSLIAFGEFNAFSNTTGP